jgi:hypothetical protein
VGLTEDKLVSDGVPHHSSRQSNTGTSSTGRVHSSRSDLGDVLEELRLGDSWVSHEADVEVSPDPHPVSHPLRDSSDEEQQQCLLDVLVSKDLGCDTRGELGVECRVRLELCNVGLDLVGELHCLVLLLELVDVVRFEVRVGEETQLHGLEAFVGDGEEDASDVDDISGRDLASLVAIEVDRHGARNVSDGDLVRLRSSNASVSSRSRAQSGTHHLLDLALLEGSELASPRLHVQLASTVVHNADLADALGEGCNLPLVDVLKDLGSTGIASIRVDLQERLDFGDARDDSSDGNELAQVSSTDLTNGERDVGGERLEVEVATGGGSQSCSLALLEDTRLTIVGGDSEGRPGGQPPRSQRSSRYAGIG